MVMEAPSSWTCYEEHITPRIYVRENHSIYTRKQKRKNAGFYIFFKGVPPKCQGPPVRSHLSKALLSCCNATLIDGLMGDIPCPNYNHFTLPPNINVHLMSQAICSIPQIPKVQWLTSLSPRYQASKQTFRQETL